MRVLLTEGAGFIGSHVAAAYARSGHHAVVLEGDDHQAARWGRHPSSVAPGLIQPVFRRA